MLKDRAVIRAALTLREAQDMKFGEGNYLDTGCEESPKCEACPLPKCKYEMSKIDKRISEKQIRNTKIHKAHALGASAQQIAEAAGMSERNVYHVLKGSKG